MAGVVFSHELWFPVARTFPRAPFLFDLPENRVLPIERLLGAVLIASLAAVVFIRLRIFLDAALAAGALLIFFDQTRMQPWVYQYLLMLSVFALRSPQTNESDSGANQTLGLLQILIAGLYVWSGVQKMNYTFARETLPFLLAPLENLFPAIESAFAFLGIAAAIFESLVGIGLLFRRTRNAAVIAAILTHVVILSLLMARNYNGIVWIWNAALIAAVFIAFWRSDVSVWRAFAESVSGGWRKRATKTMVAASVLLPALSFFGWWDMYLSGALYSGGTETAVISVNKEVIEKLPPKAARVVFQTNNGSLAVLPLFEWAMAEMNVPVYPERRVFKQTAREVCRLANDKNEIELIIKERPAILDGSYRITRMRCAEIEK